MIRLHLNESPYPPSRNVVEYVSKYAEYLNLYKHDDLYNELIKELESYTKVDHSFLDIYPGSAAAVTLMLTYTKIIDSELVIVHPTFHAIYSLARNYGVKLVPVKLVGELFELNPSELIKACGNRVVYIVNPNNPTSNILLEDPDIVRRVSNLARAVFIDEAYYEFSGITFKDLVSELPNIVILRTFSKAFSLAGARFGYTITSSELKKTIRKLRIGFEVPLSTQAAALGALRDLNYTREIISKIIETRSWTRRRLADIGLNSVESSTNFVFINMGEPCGRAWSELKEAGILTMCLQNIDDLSEYSNYMRVTIGKPGDMEVFVEKMKQLIGSRGSTENNA
ncbi:MAG: pyridoxal phosphate-dependent aminotransferase [Desulfurococcaceae archaeon]